MVHFISFHRNFQRNGKDITALLGDRDGTCVSNCTLLLLFSLVKFVLSETHTNILGCLKD